VLLGSFQDELVLYLGAPKLGWPPLPYLGQPSPSLMSKAPRLKASREACSFFTCIGRDTVQDHPMQRVTAPQPIFLFLSLPFWMSCKGMLP